MSINSPSALSERFSMRLETGFDDGGPSLKLDGFLTTNYFRNLKKSMLKIFTSNYRIVE